MKVGRNEPCPCGSGKKYKRCCSIITTAKSEEQTQHKKVTLGGTIAEFQSYAAEKKEMMRQVGVFLIYSDKNGDSWVLEVTDSDCIQVASNGEPLDVPLEENDETIVIDWSHSFSFKKKQLNLKAHRSKETLVLKNAPSQKLYAASRKVLKRISPEFREQVHVEE